MNILKLARSEGGCSNTNLTPWEPNKTSLVKNFSTPVIGTKDGAYFIRCTGSKRNNADTSDEANILILDGDKRIDDYGEPIPGAPNPELVHQFLTSLGVCHLIYSSFSNGRTSDELEAECIYSGGLSGADYHKYRVIIPCSYAPEQLPILLNYLFSELHQADVMLAPVNENRAWSQPWYFPRVPDEQRKSQFKFYQHDGSPLDAYTTTKDWLREHPQPVRAEPLPLKPKKQIDESNGRRNPLREFNQSYSLHDVLIRNGYIQKGLKYLRPDSESKIPGVQVCLLCKDGVERIYSHGGDVLNDDFSHDAFDVMRLLEQGGDWKKALNWSSEITMHNRNIHREEKQKQEQEQKNKNGSGSKEKNLIVANIAELLGHNFPPREAILTPVFTLVSMNMIFSARGVGKTHVGLGIAYAAASGASFWNWTAKRPIKTLYIDGEMPGESLQERFAAIVHNAEAEPSPDFLKIITIDMNEGAMPDLSTLGGQIQIEDACMDAELIIVDNLSCLARSGRENEAESWGSISEWALRLRSAGKCVIFMHHAGKNGLQRGTSKREDLLDIIIELKRPTDYDSSEGARFVVNFPKARHLVGSEAAPFEAWLQNGKWKITAAVESTMQQVVELANLDMTQTEIANELGINKSTVCRAWKEAVINGQIETTKRGKTGPKLEPKTRMPYVD